MPDTDLREIAQRVVDKWDSEKDSMMQITLTDDGIETGPVTDPDSVLLARAYLDLTAPVDAKLPKYLGDTPDCFCKNSLYDSWKFCPNCGRPIKWTK